jgi:hypothetical protein
VTTAAMVPVALWAHNAQLADHGVAAMSLGAYLESGAWWEALFENWESEFLQMGVFIVLTAKLFQRGASESHDPDDEDAVEARERKAQEEAGDDAPWPARRGGWIGAIYAHSLSIAMFALFLASFGGHAVAGAAAQRAEAAAHGEQGPGLWAYVLDAQFWFESLQNWQSEFLSVGLLVVLSIVLRERGSTESKPVAAPHAKTGAE